jgi:hypothetical protein
VLHEASPIVELVRRAGAGAVVTFASRDDVARPAAALAASWSVVLDRLPEVAAADRSALAPYLARALTARQCEVFDRAIRPLPAAEPAPCPD